MARSTAPQRGKPARGPGGVTNALFEFAVAWAGGQRAWSFAIPAPDNAIVVPGGRGRLGFDNPRVVALMRHMTTPAATYSYTDPKGNALTRVTKAGLTQRNRRSYNKRRRARSFQRRDQETDTQSHEQETDT